MQVVNKIYSLDEQAEKIGLITGISEEIYFCSISHVSQVYVEYINDVWVAWRESYVPNTNQRTSYKLITQGNFELVIARVKNYLTYIKRKKG
ncbi:pathogenicity island protein [Staphylococcus chromogenes]|uniref:pathogenicity island protein n=1 Tax=Staphylococcus chromogenes TaxID=46126 RepID=UPI000D1BA247|nr:pathogenicity island protein [Staphylococcus chromogenes]PTG05334.1 pathogenicity island protein [Staphylococcus chromogenes]PTG12519.1 pathogenicity island protein [Staphylococcus chromogenes]TJY14576.1 pathogenicity island protein [Staphylococcus chromogenes]